MGKVTCQNIDPTALSCHHLQCGKEDKLTQLQNRSFSGTWGYNPNTVEVITYHINLNNCSPEDVLLTFDHDKAIGYCWTEISYEREADIRERKGRIFMLGVDPDYRGRGVGRRVLLAGLAHLKSKGISIAELTVDSDNKAACTLYHSVGFEVHKSNFWYEKVMN